MEVQKFEICLLKKVLPKLAQTSSYLVIYAHLPTQKESPQEDFIVWLRSFKQESYCTEEDDTEMMLLLGSFR